MPQQHFAAWAARGPLWPRRLEWMLAQLTTVLAQVHGNKRVMADFDPFSPTQQRNLETNEAAQAMSSISGSGIRKLGQGRK